MVHVCIWTSLETYNCEIVHQSPKFLWQNLHPGIHHNLKFSEEQYAQVTARIKGGSKLIVWLETKNMNPGAGWFRDVEIMQNFVRDKWTKIWTPKASIGDKCINSTYTNESEQHKYYSRRPDARIASRMYKLSLRWVEMLQFFKFLPQFRCTRRFAKISRIIVYM